MPFFHSDSEAEKEMQRLRQRLSTLETTSQASKAEGTTLQGRVRYLEAEMGTLNLKVENMRKEVAEEFQKMRDEITALKR